MVLAGRGDVLAKTPIDPHREAGDRTHDSFEMTLNFEHAGAVTVLVEAMASH